MYVRGFPKSQKVHPCRVRAERRSFSKSPNEEEEVMTMEEYICNSCRKIIRFPHKPHDGLCRSCFNTKQICEAEAEAERKRGIPEDKNRGLRPVRY
jgi:hypothetical protein